jgi:hypothetical protein
VVYQEVYKRDIKAIKIFDFYQIEHEHLIV